MINPKTEENEYIIYEKLREDEVIKTHWIAEKYHGFHFGTKVIDNLLGAKTFDFPKSLYLMKDIIKLFTPKHGMVLDFFSGSATTAHAVIVYGNLFICLADEINEAVVRAIIERRRTYDIETSTVVLKDTGFANNDSEKLNCFELLKDAGYQDDQLMTI